MKAIQTIYNGFKFRSRLEARWAVFYDTLGIEYRYELEGFDLDDGDFYLPDFYLPGFGCWVEIKPEEPNSDELRKCQKLAQHTDQLVYLFFGDVWYNLDPDQENGILFDSQGRFHSHFYWMRCENCGCLTIGNQEVIPFSDGTNGIIPIGDCRCEAYRGVISLDVERAYIAARQARFEHRKAA